jgi:branched-chain amino acid transport system ATP-binding protein
MLRLENVSSGYGPIEILHDVSLVVNSGEVVSIIGANGAGKSTLLRTISGLVPCKGGRVVFDGADITRLSPDRVVLLRLVHVPEGRHIFAPLTVYENLLVGTYSRRRQFEKGEKEKLFDFVFNLFPILYDRKQQIAGTLSGGEQQMLALGRALVAQPKLMLLDEPSLGLAPLIVRSISHLIQKLNQQGLTILLVEQNALLALTIASRAYVLNVGRIAIEGVASDLLRNDQVRRIYLGEGFTSEGDLDN